MGTLYRLAPLTGLIAVVLIVIGAAVGGEIPDLDDGIDEVAAFYVDEGDSQVAGSILLAYGAFLFVAFMVILRNVLRALDERSEPATVALSGGIILAVGMLLFAGIGFALGDLADELDPVAIQALHALNEDLFLPAAAGNALLMWGATFAILRGAPLPRWLGWAALVIAVASVTPAGFIAILATGIWVAIASVILTLRAGQAQAPPAAERRPPPPA